MSRPSINEDSSDSDDTDEEEDEELLKSPVGRKISISSTGNPEMDERFVIVFKSYSSLKKLY